MLSNKQLQKKMANSGVPELVSLAPNFIKAKQIVDALLEAPDKLASIELPRGARFNISIDYVSDAEFENCVKWILTAADEYATERLKKEKRRKT